MPLYTVDQLNASLKGGARSDKYYIEIGTPIGNASLSFSEDELILCNVASFPARNMGETNAWVQGRKLKYPGDSVFDEGWTITFYNTPNHDNRKKFIEWMNNIDTYVDNKHTCFPQDYMVNLKVHQVSCDGSNVASYQFFNAFPSNVSAIEIGSDKINTIQEFTVTFTYSHWDKIN